MTGRKQVEISRIRLRLVKDVTKLMVHGAEIRVIHQVNVTDIHIVDIKKSHLKSTLSKAEDHAAGACIVGRRTDEVKDTRAVALDPCWRLRRRGRSGISA